MIKKKGLFIVFEGIDGAGTTTQTELLEKHCKKLANGHFEVESGCEPWNDGYIRKKLLQDKSPYSDAELMAKLYVDDRKDHTKIEIFPIINRGGIYISDRYTLSTCTYQVAQGLDLQTLTKMHETGILIPNVTFYIDIERGIAKERKIQRILKQFGSNVNIEEKLEKFDRDPVFIDTLIQQYRHLAELANSNTQLFGKVMKIDGNKPVEEVSSEIIKYFNLVYHDWKKS
ncbi:dTMP kinase [Candidatus Woesearchaeota archaeon]|nr:dTMP kinase [Candidatus Woesearchaeota archaeon]